MSTVSPEELITSTTGYLVLRLGELVRARLDTALGPWGLTGRELRVLGFAYGKRLSQRELAELTNLDRTTMVAVTDKLERLGFVRRERDSTDRRKYLVTVSANGKQAVEAATRQLAVAEQEFLAVLDDTEQRQLNELVTRLFRAHDPSCEPS